jgi:hypothetical protein
MDLSEIWLLAEPPDVIEMLIGSARMSIALDAKVLYETDHIFGRLAEDVLATDLHAKNLGSVIFFGARGASGVCRGENSKVFLHVSTHVDLCVV